VHRSSPGPLDIYLGHVLHQVHLLQRIPIVGLRGVGICGVFIIFNSSLDGDMNFNLIVVNRNVSSSTKVPSALGKEINSSINFEL